MADPGFSLGVGGGGGRQLPKVGVLKYYFAKNCMKMKEFGPPGARPWRPLRSATDKCSHWSKTGRENRTNCFPLCQSRYLNCPWYPSRGVWISHDCFMCNQMCQNLDLTRDLGSLCTCHIGLVLQSITGKVILVSLLVVISLRCIT